MTINLDWRRLMRLWQRSCRFFVVSIIVSTIFPNSAFSENPPPPPPSPPDSDTPDGPQESGGTRPTYSRCPELDTSIVSFLPESTDIFTKSANFWFYIPFTPNEVDSFVFILEERSGGLISQEDPRILRTERMDFSETPGFIQLRLPSDKLLEFGQSYKWRLLVYCDPNNEDDFITMSGAIAPTEPNFQLRSQLASSSPLDRVDLYLQNEYWYDAFSLLATLRSEEPNNTELLDVWEWFFQEFELEEISSEAISPCCLVEDAGRDVR